MLLKLENSPSWYIKNSALADFAIKLLFVWKNYFMLQLLTLTMPFEVAMALLAKQLTQAYTHIGLVSRRTKGVETILVPVIIRVIFVSK